MMQCTRHCVNNLRTLSKSFLKCDNTNLSQQIRTTFILKRRHPAPLLKKGQSQGRFKRKHYIYDLIENTNCKPQKPLDIILLKDVDDIGQAGQQVSVKPGLAYKTLLLPGLAAYASPENIEKYKNLFKSRKEEESAYIPPSVKKTIEILSTFCLSLTMSIDHPWTLEKWHVRANFRKAGVWVPEEAITMPDKVITGPDLSKENKEFYVTVTVNNKNQVNVRCKIHHWGNSASKRLPYVPEFWKLPSEPIFLEDKPILDSLPVHKSMQKEMK